MIRWYTHQQAHWPLENVHEADRLRFSTGFLRSRLLKKLILLFLFCKYNLAPSSITTQVYRKDVVHAMQIMKRHLFNIAEQCIYQAKDSLKHPRMMKLVLFLPSLTMRIFTSKEHSHHRLIHCHTVLRPYLTTVHQSLSACSKQVPESILLGRCAEAPTETPATQYAVKSKNKVKQDMHTIFPYRQRPHQTTCIDRWLSSFSLSLRG